MGDILAKALGFILIIAVAYLFKKKGIFKKEDANLLGVMLLNINLPCVIISGFRTFQFDTSLIIAIFICIAASLGSLVVSYFVSRNASKESQALHMIGSTGYNIGIFTVPFVSSFMSANAVVCALMFDIGNAVMVFGTTAAITSAVVNKQKTNPIPAIIKKLFTTVPFVTYMCVLITVLLGIKLPSGVYVITDIGTSATSFLAMVMIGIMIEFNIKKEDAKEAASAILTRYGYSLVVCVLIYMLPYDIEARKAMIIAMCSPLSTAATVFGRQLGCKESVLGVFNSLNIVISMILIISIVIFL